MEAGRRPPGAHEEPGAWWTSPARRALWAHAAGLLVVLFLAGAAIGTHASFLPDEGATILQARMLATGHGWVERPPLLARVDPAGSWYPLDNADHSRRGFAPFAKHPLYAVLAAAAYRLSGVAGIVGLSLLGTFAAALLSAFLARRVDTRLAIPTLWAVGVASPLLFDASMAVAHTLAAALCVGAVLVLVSGSDAPSSVGTRAVLVATAVGLAAVLRSEALLFGASLAVVGLVFGLARRSPGYVVGGIAAAVGAVLARQVEGVWRAHILGSRAVAAIPAAVASSGHASFLSDRWLGFRHTWIDPSHLWVPAGDAILLASWVLVALFALLMRQRVPDRRITVMVTAALVVSSLARLAVAPRTPVPGLLMAFPLLWGGLLVLTIDAGATEWMCLAVAGMFSGAVIATQYPVGGSLEWGGRYFALAIPVVVPAVIAAIRRAGLRLTADVRRLAAVAVVVPSVAMAVLAVWSLGDYHRDTGRLVALVDASGRGVSDPVVVTNVPWLGRISWRTYPHQQWLYVPPADTAVAAERIAATAVKRMTLVTLGYDCPAAAYPGWHATGQTTVPTNGRMFRITKLAAGAGPSGCAGATG